MCLVKGFPVVQTVPVRRRWEGFEVHVVSGAHLLHDLHRGPLPAAIGWLDVMLRIGGEGEVAVIWIVSPNH